MTRFALAIGLLMGALASSASDASDSVVEKVVTRDGAVVCAFPFNLKEAYQAVIADDSQWLKSMACGAIRGGIAVTVIDRHKDAWQVRLHPPDSNGLTVWGSRLEFRTPDGDYLDDYGRPIRK